MTPVTNATAKMVTMSLSAKSATGTKASTLSICQNLKKADKQQKKAARKDGFFITRYPILFPAAVYETTY